MSIARSVVQAPRKINTTSRLLPLRASKLSVVCGLTTKDTLPRKAFFGELQAVRPAARTSVVAAAAASDKPKDPLEKAAAAVFGEKLAPKAVTLGFILLWYALNIGFNLQNKWLYKYFPFPWAVSTVHVLVGTVYCGVAYLLGAKKASFERPITGDEAKKIFLPATMHALGHIAANVSFAAVAISLTHTVKTLEPAFNVVFKQLLLGQATPLPVAATLVPIMVGVAMASASELSFNWLGFLSAMASNVTFGLRAILGKGAMSFLGSTGVYAYTTLISLFICAPLTLIVEGPQLKAGIDAAIASLGLQQFLVSLTSVGLLYHLYNQFAFNTLERVDPVAHGVCNVVKRVAIIATSVVFFGNVMSTQTKIGTAIAIFGTWLYTEASEKAKHKKSAPPATGGAAA